MVGRMAGNGQRVVIYSCYHFADAGHFGAGSGAAGATEEVDE